MHELLARNWAWVLVRGIFTLLFGALAIFLPGLTLFALIILFGVYAIIDGVTAVAIGARRSSGRGWVIAIGILGIIAGAVALIWPGITAIALLYVIAFWALIIGIDYIVEGVRLRDSGGRLMLIVSGLVAALLGVLLLFQPDEGALAVVFTIGFLAALWGVVTIVTSIRLRRLSTELQSH